MNPILRTIAQRPASQERLQERLREKHKRRAGYRREHKNWLRLAMGQEGRLEHVAD